MVFGNITETLLKEKITKAVSKQEGINKETELRIFEEVKEYDYYSYSTYGSRKITYTLDDVRIVFKSKGNYCVSVYLNPGKYNAKTINIYCVDSCCSKCIKSNLERAQLKAEREKQESCKHNELKFASGFYGVLVINCANCNSRISNVYTGDLTKALEKNNVDIQKILKDTIF